MFAALRANAWAAAAFVWGVAEATLFFIVPDVLLSFVGLRRGAASGLAAALCAALGAGAGGAIMYAWSARDGAGAEAAVLAVPAISTAMMAHAEAAMAAQGWFLATLLGPLSSTPYKVFAVLAPHVGAGLAPFALASIVARLPRFLLAALAAALVRRILPRMSLARLSWALGAFWALFYVMFFTVTPG